MPSMPKAGPSTRLGGSAISHAQMRGRGRMASKDQGLAAACLTLSRACASGATHYVEPKPVIGLNNLEARLEAAEAEEEENVLGQLSQTVAANAGAILQVCNFGCASVQA